MASKGRRLWKDVYEKGHYQQTDRDKPLPLRWMSLESLKEGIYTTQSDVVWVNGNDRLFFKFLLLCSSA